MDLRDAIRQLLDEKERIDKAIECLESLYPGSTVSRRGRKGMAEAERLEVSDRMTQYWARRRKAKGERNPKKE